MSGAHEYWYDLAECEALGVEYVPRLPTAEEIARANWATTRRLPTDTAERLLLEAMRDGETRTGALSRRVYWAATSKARSDVCTLMDALVRRGLVRAVCKGTWALTGNGRQVAA